MIIQITADTVVWFIAIMLVVLCVLLFMAIMALRVLAGVVNYQMTELRKRIPKGFGGGGKEGEGGAPGIMDIVGGLAGGLFK